MWLVFSCKALSGTSRGISFMDFTSLKVCHNCRIQLHKVFKNLAAGGKTSVDCFLGFKSASGG
ncbi:transposase [Microcoleus sp. A006_D1]|uniref:transposase n=1 Tax=Microcoleus sp. A006_D1 TaxID=3055267 RepID=UPI003FA5B02C